jgi:hypothetical protein
VCLRTAVHHHSWRKAKQKKVDAVGDRQRIAMVVQIPNYTELATSGGVVRPKKRERLEPEMSVSIRWIYPLLSK